MIASALLHAGQAATFAIKTLYLPASVFESIAMMGPAVQFFLVLIFQPGLEYNTWVYVSIPVICVGGLMVGIAIGLQPSMLAQPVDAGARSNTWIIGVVVAVLAVFIRCGRVMLIDHIMGGYQARMQADARNGDALPLLEENEGGTATTTTPGGGAEDDSRPRGKKWDVITLMGIIMPLGCVIALLCSFLIPPDVSYRHGYEWRVPGLINHDHHPWALLVLELLRGSFCSVWFLTEFLLNQNCGALAVGIFANVNRVGSIIFCALFLGEATHWLQ